MTLSSKDISDALRRTRLPIFWIGLAYLVGTSTGAILVHAHSSFALDYHDRLVGRAYQSDPAAILLTLGHWIRAAIADFAGNLLAGAVTSTIMGLSVVLPFPVAAYRGWVGGIVSVDGHHASRLADPRECAYYLGVLVLQLIPYRFAAAAGVRLGLACSRTAAGPTRSKNVGSACPPRASAMYCAFTCLSFRCSLLHRSSSSPLGNRYGLRTGKNGSMVPLFLRKNDVIGIRRDFAQVCRNLTSLFLNLSYLPFFALTSPISHAAPPRSLHEPQPRACVFHLHRPISP